MTDHSQPGQLYFWQRTSLVLRLTFLAVLPAALIALLVGSLLAYGQVMELRHMADVSSRAIALQILDVSARAMRLRDRRELALVAREYVQHPYVNRVQILAPDGEVLADARDLTAPLDPHPLKFVVPDQAHWKIRGGVIISFHLAGVYAERRASFYDAVRWVLLGLLIIGIFGWLAARYISAPLRELAAAVSELGSGSRGVRVAVNRGAEIGELQRGFNNAAEALHDNFVHMQDRIAQATEALAHKNTELENASQAKTRFLAAASHDLRQPLYALTLFSSALKAAEHDSEQSHHISQIQECVGSLDRLFSELLDLSLLEAGAMQVSIGEFALDPMFEEVSRSFRQTAEERGLRLSVRKTDLWVRSDRVMLARIFNNLVSNGLRYTCKGGVLLGARCRGDAVRIDVWDTGRGIASEHQALVFEEFYRVEGTENRPPPGRRNRGLGLGLATVQRLAALLGTRVELRSRQGRGTMFSVVVPRAVEGQLSESVAVEETPLDVTGLRVLVIDDEPTILEGMRVLMRSWGCEVRTAENREQMLQVAEEWPVPPDLVLTDLRLGGHLSGLDLLRMLDRHYGGDGRDGPCFARILITGETKSERLREIMAARVPVLFKPVSPQQLREALVVALAMSRAQAGAASHTTAGPASQASSVEAAARTSATSQSL